MSRSLLFKELLGWNEAIISLLNIWEFFLYIYIGYLRQLARHLG